MKTQTQNFLPIMIGGCLILLVGFSIRASFGLFQIPIKDELNWPISYFSLAIAIQNLAWGIGQPIFGAIAERFGDRRAIFLGIICYVLGLSLTSQTFSPVTVSALEVLVGFGIAGMGFGVILAMLGRLATDENRSLVLGIATAAGSAGQVFGPPLVELLLGVTNWRNVFLIMAIMVMMSTALLFLIPKQDEANRSQKGELKKVLSLAFSDINYHYIFLGFFSCGFQLAFITAHFPAMIRQFCGPIDTGSLLSNLGVNDTTALGAFAIAVIGFMNIAGSIFAGWIGKRYSKKYALSLIYLGRTLIAIWFILTPITPNTVIIFSAVMGLLWLATVPLTSGLVGYIYGLKFMGTLYGIIFFSHQLGSFFGVYIGGLLFDRFGNYDFVWWIGIGVGAFSAIIHLPIRELPQNAPKF